MKKILLFVLMCVVCFSAIGAIADTAEEYVVPYKLIADMKALSANNVIMENGRTCVPIRELLQATGATVKWDNPTKTVSITRDGRTVEVSIGSNIMKTPEEEITIDVAPFLYEDTTTYVPLRPICEAFGFKLFWDTPSKTIVVESPGGKRIYDNNFGYTLEEALQYHNTTAEEYFRSTGMNIEDYPALKDMYWWQVTQALTLGNIATANNTTPDNLCKVIGIDPDTSADTLWVDIVDNMTMREYLTYMTPSLQGNIPIEIAFEVFCTKYELGRKYQKIGIMPEGELPDEYTLDTKYKFARLKIEEMQFRGDKHEYDMYLYDLEMADKKYTDTVTYDSLTQRTIGFTMHMNDGAKLKGVLYPDLAPHLTAYFITLAEEGYFDGLTFDEFIRDDYVRFGYCSPGRGLKTPKTTYDESSSVNDNLRVTLPAQKGLLIKGHTSGHLYDDGVFNVLIGDKPKKNEVEVFGKIDDEGLKLIDNMMEKTLLMSNNRFGVPNDSIIIKKLVIDD